MTEPKHFQFEFDVVTLEEIGGPLWHDDGSPRYLSQLEEMMDKITTEGHYEYNDGNYKFSIDYRNLEET